MRVTLNLPEDVLYDALDVLSELVNDHGEGVDGIEAATATDVLDGLSASINDAEPDEIDDEDDLPPEAA